jgi:hypothetical protein
MEKVPNGNFSVDGELRFSSGNSGDNSSPHHADGTATTPSILKATFFKMESYKVLFQLLATP